MTMHVDALLARLTDELQQVPGIAGIVLGGSRARGTHTPASDVDLGLYYDPECPIDLEQLRDVMGRLDDRHRREAVTEPGEWGPWINGGGWFSVDGVAVDLLYRDLAVARSCIKQCRAGIVRIEYQAGHPHGFSTAVYMAEVALCRVLWDPHGAVAVLKRGTVPYPAALKAALIEKFFWEAGFSVQIAAKGVDRLDVSYVAGCCFRAISCLTQALFALNDEYWMNEKGAVARVRALSQAPDQFAERVNTVFEQLAPDNARLAAALKGLEQLVADTEALLRR